jgi:hypothetical protein
MDDIRRAAAPEAMFGAQAEATRNFEKLSTPFNPWTPPVDGDTRLPFVDEDAAESEPSSPVAKLFSSTWAAVRDPAVFAIGSIKKRRVYNPATPKERRTARRQIVFKFAVIGILLIAAANLTHAQSAKETPAICVHGEGTWSPKDSILSVITYSKGCDVATASRTYSWAKDDAHDFDGMVTDQSNVGAFTSGCLEEETANKTTDCGQAMHDLIAISLHAARAKRESLCSRHRDWWVVSLDDSGAFGNLQSCSD